MLLEPAARNHLMRSQQTSARIHWPVQIQNDILILLQRIQQLTGIT